MTTCEWRLEDDDGSLIGSECGLPAQWRSCRPFIDAPTCTEHKCRCATPLHGLQPEPCATTDIDIPKWVSQIRGSLAHGYKESAQLLLESLGVTEPTPEQLNRASWFIRHRDTWRSAAMRETCAEVLDGFAREADAVDDATAAMWAEECARRIRALRGAP